MRLWHPDLIPHLPRQQLLGQHRECCAMRGLGWGRKHSVVNYVWEHPRSWLVRYHLVVIAEMDKRGYKVTDAWRFPQYRGKRVSCEDVDMQDAQDYPEHNQKYLAECMFNLKSKGHDRLFHDLLGRFHTRSLWERHLYMIMVDLFIDVGITSTGTRLAANAGEVLQCYTHGGIDVFFFAEDDSLVALPGWNAMVASIDIGD